MSALGPNDRVRIDPAYINQLNVPHCLRLLLTAHNGVIIRAVPQDFVAVLWDGWRDPLWIPCEYLVPEKTAEDLATEVEVERDMSQYKFVHPHPRDS